MVKKYNDLITRFASSAEALAQTERELAEARSKLEEEESAHRNSQKALMSAFREIEALKNRSTSPDNAIEPPKDKQKNLPASRKPSPLLSVHGTHTPTASIPAGSGTHTPFGIPPVALDISGLSALELGETVKLNLKVD